MPKKNSHKKGWNVIATGRLFLRFWFLLWSVPWLIFSGATVSAYVTDREIYNPVNYFSFLPLDVGKSYIDPAFGTVIKRVSNSPSEPNRAHTGNLAFIVNEYATMTPFNSDNSLTLLQHQSYFGLYDGEGNYLRDLPFEINASSGPRWSRHDPNALYYHSGNQLKQYNVATGLASVVRTFTEYSTISGYGESDISVDGDHFVLVGDNRDIFVYQISTDTKGPVLNTAGLGGFDQVQITPDNRVLVGWYAIGTGRYQGVELYDRNMTFLRQVTRAVGHMDVARDIDGEEVLVWINAADANAPANCQNGVMKVRLSDTRQSCLISFDWSLAVHVSAPDTGGWVFVSTYAPADPAPLLGNWTKYTNEILQVKLDGSEVRRLAHHRSRPFNSYYWTPRAAASRDGARLVYSSNHGLQLILGHPGDYSDVYLIDVSSSATSSGGSDRSITKRFEQDSPAVSYSCPSGFTWHTSTYGGHSGGSAVLGMDAGCLATFNFTGTAVSWIGYRDEWSGIARVYIDGTLRAEIDTYSSPYQAQAVIYTVSGLSSGPHTVTIEATGSSSPASGGSWVWVDAFEVVARVEEDDPAVSYGCPPYVTWHVNTLSLHSGGSAVHGMDAGCRATFNFTGTAVSWIGYRDEWSGIARVYIDGTLRAEIDTYSSPYQAQAVIYTVSELSSGPHTVTIEALGSRSPASGGSWVWVDAFETLPD